MAYDLLVLLAVDGYQTLRGALRAVTPAAQDARMRELTAIRVPGLSGADPHDVGDLEELRLRQLVVAPVLEETELLLSAEALKH